MPKIINYGQQVFPSFFLSFLGQTAAVDYLMRNGAGVHVKVNIFWEGHKISKNHLIWIWLELLLQFEIGVCNRKSSGNSSTYVKSRGSLKWLKNNNKQAEPLFRNWKKVLL